MNALDAQTNCLIEELSYSYYTIINRYCQIGDHVISHIKYLMILCPSLLILDIY